METLGASEGEGEEESLRLLPFELGQEVSIPQQQQHKQQQQQQKENLQGGKATADARTSATAAAVADTYMPAPLKAQEVRKSGRRRQYSTNNNSSNSVGGGGGTTTSSASAPVTTINIAHFLDLIHLCSFAFQFCFPLWLSLLFGKSAYLWLGWMLSYSNYNLLLWALGKAGFEGEVQRALQGQDEGRDFILEIVKRISVIIVSNDLLCYLLTSWKYYTAPPPTDTISMLIPRWIGVVMILLNLAYKVEYLWETPFAWLEIYTANSGSEQLRNSSASSIMDEAIASEEEMKMNTSTSFPQGNKNTQQQYPLDPFSETSSIHTSSIIDTSPLIDKIPHPNYSIGCIGYYGMALFTQSYIILFAALFHHFTHLIFLFWCERPALYKRFSDVGAVKSDVEADREYLESLHVYFNQDLIIFSNLDLFRSGDAITIFILTYTIISSIVIGPIKTETHASFYLGQAVFWRTFHSLVLGLVLYQQKTSKFWTRYFLRRGDGVVQAFQHWKLLFNLSLTMTYCSYAVCAWRFYKVPVFTMTDAQLLKHIIGLLLIGLHGWISTVVFQVTGPLAWFHAEFFIETATLPASLTFKRRQQGPFKYLEHPLLYNFSCWGLVLICGRWELFWLTLYGQIAHIVFLFCVKDHGNEGWFSLGRWLGMRRSGGLLLTPKGSREDVGIMKGGLGAGGEFISRTSSGAGVRLSRNPSMRSSSRGRTDSHDTDLDSTNNPGGTLFHFSDDGDGDEEMIFDDGASSAGSLNITPSKEVVDSQLHKTIKRVVKELEELVDTAKPHVENLVRKTRRSVVNLANAARMQETLPLRELPTSLYTLQVSTSSQRPTIVNGGLLPAIVEQNVEPLPQIPFGSSLHIHFTGCRETMKRKDWVAIYPVDANFDPTITTSTCGSRWSFLAGPISPSDPANPDAHLFTRSIDRQFRFGQTLVNMTKSPIPGLRIVGGSVEFQHYQIPWRAGIYEIRYHHDGKYNVLTRSNPFQISLDRLEPPSSTQQIVEQLLPIISNCLDLTGLDEEPLSPDEGMLARVLIPAPILESISLIAYQKQVSQRIVYVVQTLYGVDFSWKAIDNLYSLQTLAERIFEALLVLH